MRVDNIYRKPSSAIGVVVDQAPIENLVFEGGGPKGLVYVGALEVLEEKGVLAEARNVGGSSVGAITALTVALGYDAASIRDIVFRQDISDFTDVSEEEIDGRFRALKTTWRALRNLTHESEDKGKGTFLGEKLRTRVRETIAGRVEDAREPAEAAGDERLALWRELNAKQGALTFTDLVRLGAGFPELGIKSLSITGTNYTDQTLEIFSPFDTPAMRIDLAIRISGSVPWFFKSVKYEGKEYMDGGCLSNYPMGIFDADIYRQKGRPKWFRGVDGQNLATLGFKVDSLEEIRRILWEGAKEDDSGWFGSLIDGVKDTVVDTVVGVNYSAASRANDAGTYGKYAQRTIQIPDLGYSLFGFDLDNEDKTRLADAGRRATTEWFGLYYDDAGIELELSAIAELENYLTEAEMVDARSRFPAAFA